MPNSQVLSALASLTKGGLNAVTKALAVEYSDRGIRADTVALGVIRTPMHDPSSYDTLAKLHLAGRLDEIDDVVDAQEPECVVDAFTDAAIFQGLHPYSVGRQAVAAYYAAQPRGIAVWDLILKTRSPSNDLVLGYVSAQFTFPEPPTATDAEICRKGSS